MAVTSDSSPEAGAGDYSLPHPRHIALRAALSAVDHIPAAEIPAAIGDLETAKARLWARLTAGQNNSSTEPAHDIDQKEAARLRPGLGLKSIRFLTRTGRVPSVRRGKRRLVRLADLDAYVDRCRSQGVALGTVRR